MRRDVRIGLGVLLVVAGLFVAIFFALLFFVADCSQDCGRRGEHAPVYALVGAGLGVVVAGASLGAGLRRAWGAGLVVAGLVSLLGSAWALTQGEGGWVWGSLAGGLVGAGTGAWLLRSAGPRPPSIL